MNGIQDLEDLNQNNVLNAKVQIGINPKKRKRRNMENKLFEIKNRFNGSVIFSLECKSFKVCVEAKIKLDANLYGANLFRANLSRANLSGADLSGADLSGADLFRADLFRADLSGADLSGADLSRANLSGADLYGANLSRADLSGADLYGANLDGADGEKTTLKNIPLQTLGLRWPIMIFDKDIKIGCEYHSIKDWGKFKDDRISEMDGDALKFWKTNKKSIMAICKANGRE